MKTTLRRIIATSLSAAALSLGLATVATPAQAASCADLDSIKGGVSTAQYTRGSARYQINATVTNGVTGCTGSNVYYVLEVLDGSDRVALRIDSRNTVRPIGSGSTSYDTYIGAGTSDYIASTDTYIGFRVMAVNRSYGFVVGTATWAVEAPNDGFDSATGDDVLNFGQSCPATVRGSYC